VHTIAYVIAAGWVAFWTYWIVAAFRMKRGRILWRREVRIRVVLVVLAVAVARLGLFRMHGLRTGPWLAGIGLVLFAAGLALAVWARLHLGRNWGGPMTQKADPELVTSGPYRLVRHPIYSGILVAFTGSALALDWAWLVVVVLTGVYFVHSATVEERHLSQAFPDTYPEYRRSTRMLVPFLF